MASEQIAALTKTLTESLIDQQKAQQERLKHLSYSKLQITDYFVKLLSQKSNDSASRFFLAEGIANSLAEFKYDPERSDTFPA